MKMSTTNLSQKSLVLESSVKPSQCCQTVCPLARFDRSFKNHRLRLVWAVEG